MRSRAIAVGTFAAVIALAPAGESASRATIASNLNVSGFGSGPGHANLQGSVESNRAVCLARRTVAMYAIRQNGEPKLFSRDRSSRNGFWGGEGQSSTPKAFRAVLKPREISRRKTCSGDKQRVSVPTGPGIGTARAEVPTELSIRGAQYGPDFVFVDGSIKARKPCRSKRRVNVLALTSTDPVLVDFDRASRNGYFGGGGPTSDATGVRALAPAKDIPGDDSCAEGSDQAP